MLFAGGGCPFCLLAAKAESGLLRVYLEGMLIDIDWRGRVLNEWLCRGHLSGMQSQARKLGGAIVAQAMLRHALGLLEQDKRLPSWGTTCVACRDIEQTVRHHVQSFLQSWLSEPDFRRLAAAADAFCLPHFAMVLASAGSLPRREQTIVREALTRRQLEALAPLQSQIDWFVKKFDARFQAEPWNGAEDSVERAVDVLTGGGR